MRSSHGVLGRCAVLVKRVLVLLSRFGSGWLNSDPKPVAEKFRCAGKNFQYDGVDNSLFPRISVPVLLMNNTVLSERLLIYLG